MRITKGVHADGFKGELSLMSGDVVSHSRMTSEEGFEETMDFLAGFVRDRVAGGSVDLEGGLVTHLLVRMEPEARRAVLGKFCEECGAVGEQHEAGCPRRSA